MCVEGGVDRFTMRRLPSILDGRYFQVISSTPVSIGNQNGKRSKFSAVCVACSRTFSYSTSTNFRFHLKRHHPELHESFLSTVVVKTQSTGTHPRKRSYRGKKSSRGRKFPKDDSAPDIKNKYELFE